MRMGILSCSPPVRRRLQHFSVNYVIYCRFFTDVFYKTKEVCFYSWFPESFHKKECEFCQVAFIYNKVLLLFY